jgi:periplasmic divalent cation tolerance protein
VAQPFLAVLLDLSNIIPHLNLKVGSYDPTPPIFSLFFSAPLCVLRASALSFSVFLLHPNQIRYNLSTYPMPPTTQFRLVLVTCPTPSEARKISRALLQKHIAACVNIHSAPIESIYRWKGKIETAREHLLLIKTTTRRLKSLEREVLRLHSYETPEFLVLPISSGSQAYLHWLSASCKK